MLKLGCILIDALDAVGGQCTALYPEKPIYDIPGHPAIEGGALIDALDRQIAPFDVPRLLGRRVESLEGTRGSFRLGTSNGDTIHAHAVIIAAGAGAFGPNRPPLEGLEAFERSGGVQYFVRRRADFANRDVLIAGGGDSAVDWALSLREVARSVKLVHRRDRFRAAPESLRQLDEAVARGEVEKIIGYQLHGLHGTDGQLAGVDLATLDGTVRHVACDHLLPFFGLATDLGPIAQWGLDTVRGTIPVTPSTCESSLSGIFAVGDVATYPGKLKLILQALAKGHGRTRHPSHRTPRNRATFRIFNQQGRAHHLNLPHPLL